MTYQGRNRSLFVLLVFAPLLLARGVCASVGVAGFSRPIVVEGGVIAVSDLGGEVVRVSTNGNVLWRTCLKESFMSVWDAGGDRLVAGYKNGLVVLSKDNGEIALRAEIIGRVHGVSPDGMVYCHHRPSSGSASLSCYSIPKRKVLWQHDLKSEDCGTWSEVCGELILVLVSPTVLQGDQIVKGRYQLICLQRSSGHVLWKEDLSFARHGRSYTIDLASSCTSILCRIGYSLMMIEDGTGKRIASRSFASERSQSDDKDRFPFYLDLPEHTLAEALFRDTNTVVAILEPSQSASRILLLSASTLETIAEHAYRFPNYGYGVKGSTLYTGPIALDLNDMTVVSRFDGDVFGGMPLSGMYDTVCGNILFMGTGMWDTAVRAGRRLLLSWKLGTGEVRILLNEQNPRYDDDAAKEKPEQAPPDDVLKAALQE